MLIPRKEEILRLRELGYSYKQIEKEIGCSRGTISYHLGDGQKEKTRNRHRKYRGKHPYVYKTDRFKERRKREQRTHTTANTSNDKLLYVKVWDFQDRGDNKVKEFTVEEVKVKLGENPVCYLTGEEIDINKPRTYNFDHIIPTSRGGDNSLENLGICTKKANAAKSDMTHDEFVHFCKRVLEHHGYEVNKSC